MADEPDGPKQLQVSGHGLRRLWCQSESLTLISVTGSDLLASASSGALLVFTVCSAAQLKSCCDPEGSQRVWNLSNRLSDEHKLSKARALQLAGSRWCHGHEEATSWCETVVERAGALSLYSLEQCSRAEQTHWHEPGTDRCQHGRTKQQEAFSLAACFHSSHCRRTLGPRHERSRTLARSKQEAPMRPARGSVSLAGAGSEAQFCQSELWKPPNRRGSRRARG